MARRERQPPKEGQSELAAVKTQKVHSTGSARPKLLVHGLPLSLRKLSEWGSMGKVPAAQGYGICWGIECVPFRHGICVTVAPTVASGCECTGTGIGVGPVFGNIDHSKRLSRLTARGKAKGPHPGESVLPGAQHREAVASRVPISATRRASQPPTGCSGPRQCENGHDNKAA